MTPPASTEPMYLNITEGELDRLEQLGTVECGDTEAMDIGEVVRARGPVAQQAPAALEVKECKVTYCGIQSGMCAFLPEKETCSMLSHLIAQEREKWEKERDAEELAPFVKRKMAQAREDVLDDVAQYCQKYAFVDARRAGKTVSLVPLIRFIQSLRHGQKEEREPE